MAGARRDSAGRQPQFEKTTAGVADGNAQDYPEADLILTLPSSAVLTFGAVLVVAERLVAAAVTLIRWTVICAGVLLRLVGAAGMLQLVPSPFLFLFDHGTFPSKRVTVARSARVAVLPPQVSVDTDGRTLQGKRTHQKPADIHELRRYSERLPP